MALSGPGRRTPRPWLMLAVGVAAQAAGTLLVSTPAFLIPLLHTERGMSLAQAGLLAAAPNLGMVLALVAWGAAADRWGERWILAGGLALAGLAIGAASLVQGYAALGLLFVLVGVAAASTNAASGRVVIGWFPPQRRGLAMGIRQMSQPLGVAAAAVVVPPLAATSLETPLLVGVVAALVCAAACALAIVNPPRPGRAAHPEAAASPYRRDARLARIHVASALLVVPQFTLSTFGLVWLVADLGWAATAAGVLVAVAQFAGAFGRIAVGVLSDRVASRLVPLRWVAVAAVALMLLTALAGTTAQPVLVAVTFVLATCVSVADNGLAFTAVAEIAGPYWSGRALGVQNTGQFLAAAAVGPAVGGLIGLVGYPLAFALVALPPLAAVPLVPRASADPLAPTPDP